MRADIDEKDVYVEIAGRRRKVHVLFGGLVFDLDSGKGFFPLFATCTEEPLWIDVSCDVFFDGSVERRDCKFQEIEGIDDIGEHDDFVCG